MPYYLDTEMTDDSGEDNNQIISSQVGRPLSEDELIASLEAEMFLDYLLFRHYSNGEK